jgi:hypothetical protein
VRGERGERGEKGGERRERRDGGREERDEEREKIYIYQEIGARAVERITEQGAQQREWESA